MNKSKICGGIAENIAKNYLLDQGLILVEQNFYSRFGEIDIIMRDNQSLVFVEVRQRSMLDKAIESITVSKQIKLTKTAQYYLLKNNNHDNCRFDLIAIDTAKNIQWLKNIFITTT